MLPTPPSDTDGMVSVNYDNVYSIGTSYSPSDSAGDTACKYCRSGTGDSAWSDYDTNSVIGSYGTGMSDVAARTGNSSESSKVSDAASG